MSKAGKKPFPALGSTWARMKKRCMWEGFLEKVMSLLRLAEWLGSHPSYEGWTSDSCRKSCALGLRDKRVACWVLTSALQAPRTWIRSQAGTSALCVRPSHFSHSFICRVSLEILLRISKPSFLGCSNVLKNETDPQKYFMQYQLIL